MLKILNFFLFALMFFVSVALAAAPTITNVQGTIQSGQTVTITGSTLCDENTTSWWSLFKAPGVSGFEGSSFSANGYNPQTSGSGTSYGYDTNLFLDGQKSAFFQITGQHVNHENPRSSCWIEGGGGTDVFMRVYGRWTGTGWPSEWYKFIWNDNNIGSQPNQGSSLPSKWRVNHSNGNAYYYDLPTGPLQRTRWYCIEMRYRLSSPQVLQVWVDNVLLHDMSASGLGIRYPELGIINLDGTNSSFVGRVNVDAYAYGTSRIYPKSSIYISNNPNFSLGTKRWQHAQFLSDTQIKIECDLTGLGSGPYYLWIVNNRQQISAPFILGGQTSAPPPSAPSTVRIIRQD
jgi:hypothetical protein